MNMEWKPAKNAKYNDPEYVGKKFGKLTVMEINHIKQGKYNRWVWKCRCDCGNVGEYRSDYIVKGHTKSCGCVVRENKPNYKHGGSGTRLFIIWVDMRSRCGLSGSGGAFYYRYGGRGITVCEEWNDYTKFAKWALENGYSDELTLERIDNDGNYCPENCTWADRKRQARNRRTTLVVNYHGKDMSLADACETAGTPYKLAFSRIKYLNWPVNEAIDVPANESRKWKRSERYCNL